MDSICTHTLVVLVTTAIAGCAVQTVEVANRQPALEIERQSRPPGSAYLGWRVFQDRCAGCHGGAGEGTSRGPDLLPIMRTMGARQFVDVVLARYEWNLPAARSPQGSAARSALLEDVLQRREPPLAMPQWQGEPRVSAHVADLFAYLSARAQGIQGPERPQQ